MNILFINDDDIAPSRGGIKRSVDILVRAFRGHYHLRCYLAYIRGFPEDRTTDFDGKIQLTEKDAPARLEEFIMAREIDVVVLEKMLDRKYGILPVLEKVRRQRPCRSIFILHFSPDHSVLDLALANVVNNIRYSPSPSGKAVNLVKLATYPAYRSVKRALIGRGQRRIYDAFDRIVLLSDKYAPVFARSAKLRSAGKLVAISNPLTFDRHASRDEIMAKAKQVLIIARFDEKQKKLLRALKIWRRIERDAELDDWGLVIVGFGPWENRYKKFAAKLRLARVSFVAGPRDPLPYYRRASIFMMTSAYEGSGLVLSESQQMGVVPMAFDSFGALHDIIEDGVNGLIVANADLDAYAERLIWLMKNRNRREAMAGNAVESCQKFAAEVVAREWVELFRAVSAEARQAPAGPAA